MLDCGEPWRRGWIRSIDRATVKLKMMKNGEDADISSRRS
jgi:hypothetical protein